MTYYTHHKHKGVHHYACVDVLKEWSVHCFITHFTGLGVLTNKYAFMCYQMTPMNECLITHFTGIHGAHHYECVHVLPDDATINALLHIS